MQTYNELFGVIIENLAEEYNISKQELFAYAVFYPSLAQGSKIVAGKFAKAKVNRFAL